MLKFVLTAVEFEAVELPKTKSRPGDEVGNDWIVDPAVEENIAVGPTRNEGNEKVDVFVIVGVTLEMAAKLSG